MRELASQGKNMRAKAFEALHKGGPWLSRSKGNLKQKHLFGATDRVRSRHFCGVGLVLLQWLVFFGLWLFGNTSVTLNSSKVLECGCCCCCRTSFFVVLDGSNAVS